MAVQERIVSALTNMRVVIPNQSGQVEHNAIHAFFPFEDQRWRDKRDFLDSRTFLLIRACLPEKLLEGRKPSDNLGYQLFNLANSYAETKPEEAAGVIDALEAAYIGYRQRMVKTALDFTAEQFTISIMKTIQDEPENQVDTKQSTPPWAPHATHPSYISKAIRWLDRMPDVQDSIKADTLQSIIDITLKYGISGPNMLTVNLSDDWFKEQQQAQKTERIAKEINDVIMPLAVNLANALSILVDDRPANLSGESLIKWFTKAVEIGEDRFQEKEEEYLQDNLGTHEINKWRMLVIEAAYQGYFSDLNDSFGGTAVDPHGNIIADDFWDTMFFDTRTKRYQTYASCPFHVGGTPLRRS